MRALAAALLATALAAPAAAWDPPTNYALHCQGCHLADGSGTPGKVPPLAGEVGRFLARPGGRAFLVQVPGVANAPLSDADLAALLNWTLERFAGASRPAAFEPYGEAEVRRLRARPLVDVTNERRRVLEPDAR